MSVSLCGDKLRDFMIFELSNLANTNSALKLDTCLRFYLSDKKRIKFRHQIHLVTSARPLALIHPPESDESIPEHVECRYLDMMLR